MFKFWKEGVDGSFANAAPMMFEKGGGGTPPPPDPMAQANAQMVVENARAAREEENRRREEKAKAEQLAKDKATFGGRLRGEFNEGVNYGRGRMSALGLTGGDNVNSVGNTLFQNYYGKLNKGRRELVGESDISKLAGYDPDAIWKEAYDTTRSDYRNKFNSTLNSMYGIGYENNLIADTADDTYINELLGEQRTEATDAIERAKARGQLNDSSYASAQKQLSRMGSAANSKAQGLGGGILAKYRQALTGDVNSLRGRVQNYDLTDNLDLTSEQNRINAANAARLANMRGDLDAALGSEEFFDIETLLGRALASGGAGNAGTGTPGATGGLAGAMASVLSEEERRRQLQNTGVF